MKNALTLQQYSTLPVAVLVTTLFVVALGIRMAFATDAPACETECVDGICQQIGDCDTGTGEGVPGGVQLPGNGQDPLDGLIPGGQGAGGGLVPGGAGAPVGQLPGGGGNQGETRREVRRECRTTCTDGVCQQEGDCDNGGGGGAPGGGQNPIGEFFPGGEQMPGGAGAPIGQLPGGGGNQGETRREERRECRTTCVDGVCQQEGDCENGGVVGVPGGGQNPIGDLFPGGGQMPGGEAGIPGIVEGSSNSLIELFTGIWVRAINQFTGLADFPDDAPEWAAPPTDPASPEGETTVNAFAPDDSNTIIIEAGTPSRLTRVYEEAHCHTDGRWQQVDLTSAQPQTEPGWHDGVAVGSIELQEGELDSGTYCAAFMCHWRNGTQSWACGCRDASCTTQGWNTQGVRRL